MSSSGATSRTWWLPRADALFATIFAVAHGALLLSWPVALGQDAPMWIAEGAALHGMVRTGDALGCQLVPALPPNALSQAAISVLCWLMPAWLAGRVYVVACVALSAAALVYLCRARGSPDRPIVLLACLPLCVSYPLFHGFLNYMAALPVVAWGIGFLLRDPNGHGVRGTSRLLAMPLLTYICHGTALGVWAVLVGMRVLISRSRAFAVRALIGFLPVVWLASDYLHQRSGEGARVLWRDGSLLRTVSSRLGAPLRFTSLFPGFVPTFADPTLQAIAPLLMVVSVVYSLAIIFHGVRWAWRARRSAVLDDRWLSSCLRGLVALFVVMPYDVANMLNPAERLVLPAVCLGAAGLSAASEDRPFGGRRSPWVRFGLPAVLVAQWMYLAVWGTQAATIASDFINALDGEAVARGVLVVSAELVDVHADAAAGTLPLGVQLMTHHQILQSQGAIEGWVSGRSIALPLTGLFRCPAPGKVPTDLAGLRSLRQTLLLVGEPPRLAALARALGPEFRTVRNGPGFWTLVRSDKPPLRSVEN